MFLYEILANETFDEIQGYSTLTNYKEMFRKFLKTFYEGWGLEARKTIIPISVEFINDKAEKYLRFDYRMTENGGLQWLHVIEADCYY